MRHREIGTKTARLEPPAQVLLRGLSIIEALNRRPVSTIAHVADATGLPKPTVVRVLNLLTGAGFVQRLPRRRGYTLDARVLALAVGFRPENALVRAAVPLLAAFTHEHKWPVGIATRDGSTMRIGMAMLQESPMAADGDHRLIGRRVPMLTSALGRAYLAFCPEGERDEIVARLKASQHADDQSARDARVLSALLGSVRRQGYALSAPTPGDPAVGLAVPVFIGDAVLACITLRYLGKSISEAQVARRYLAPLRALARAITQAAPAAPAA